ncbi:MAG TPA: transposase [Candidatus Acidoferrales bacterium]|nr:transposase [Candidatus Acidoferrales bacterium]
MPNRRTVRIKTFDYAQPAAYFITICADGHRKIFGDIIAGKMSLNAIGTIVNESWLELTRHFPNIRLAAHVVMPNHVHGIVSIQDWPERNVRTTSADASVGSAVSSTRGSVPGSIPTIARSFKSAVSKKARRLLHKPSLRVWQRGYYEHIIRDQDDFEKTCEYIRLNPARWNLDDENPAGQT